ncbi:MAG: 4-hydroxythreonine-4-phosphate dehydrogenase PdxA [Drouetiella hepatica Uher 2000/2452]|jgi:4-hydroxythreonine-4-phosphate dehydrogenase|uniref:4-hydroxythreonine-4-phosphate dehydrogenase n=1 Tax=Drouetiella hepatica Uher 2000/2452 TaxID=904376 RepID=A0A951QDB8_9CYAN|nr:4-hydroxythreonine-4-phosphate dehydrogenase PdxA [Drouetiella hepatica Uher 2000/2452]
MAHSASSTPLSISLPSRLKLAIALGDPAGIGTEVTLKALSDPAVTQCCDVVLVGNRSLLCQSYASLSQRLGAGVSLADPTQFSIVDVPLDAAAINTIAPGQENVASGEASFRFLEKAIAQALAGEVSGIVTAPISKSAWKSAGHLYPGQTELLAERSEVQRYGMLFVARSPHTGWTLRTLLATTHIPLRQVPEALTPDLLTRKLELLLDCLQQDFGIQHPHIAIAGLNPHSGEQGQLGREEQDWLIPWIRQMGDRFPDASLQGPVPPDTLWVRPGQVWYGSADSKKVSKTAHDAYLALYHDQGLIPVKLMAFDRAVNTTIGLPFVRTSPDHGTAFDIAGQGIADATSMKSAILLAAELTQQRLVRGGETIASMTRPV